MNKIVQRTEHGASVILNAAGHQALVHRNTTIQFHDLGGLRVAVTCGDQHVECEALFPEARGGLRWSFELSDANSQPHPLRANAYKATSLEGLISDFRVALNGRL